MAIVSLNLYLNLQLPQLFFCFCYYLPLFFLKQSNQQGITFLCLTPSSNFLSHSGKPGLYKNAEFQRIARRDKKAFFSDQCKEIEENNRMGKTRDLVKKIRDAKGIFHTKMGSIKDRNGMDLTEAEDIKKR